MEALAPAPLVDVGHQVVERVDRILRVFFVIYAFPIALHKQQSQSSDADINTRKRKRERQKERLCVCVCVGKRFKLTCVNVLS